MKVHRSFLTQNKQILTDLGRETGFCQIFHSVILECVPFNIQVPNFQIPRKVRMKSDLFKSVV